VRFFRRGAKAPLSALATHVPEHLRGEEDASSALRNLSQAVYGLVLWTPTILGHTPFVSVLDKLNGLWYNIQRVSGVGLLQKRAAERVGLCSIALRFRTFPGDCFPRSGRWNELRKGLGNVGGLALEWIRLDRCYYDFLVGILAFLVLAFTAFVSSARLVMQKERRALKIRKRVGQGSWPA